MKTRQKSYNIFDNLKKTTMMLSVQLGQKQDSQNAGMFKTTLASLP